jgi:hypothetical protein
MVMVLLKLLRFFKPAGLTVMYDFSLFMFFSVAHLEFRERFNIYEGTVPYLSSAKIPLRLMAKATNIGDGEPLISQLVISTFHTSSVLFSLRGK